MKADFYKVTATDFNADIPGFESTDFPALIAEVEGYLEGIITDAGTIGNSITNNSAKAIAKLNEIMAGNLPADTMPTLPVREVDTAAGIILAGSASLETERRLLETQAVEKFAALGYPALPGGGVSAIAGIRLDVADKKGKIAAAALKEQQEKNASLFIESTMKLLDMSSQVFNSWAQFTNATVRIIGRIIADYERSPLLDAEIQVEEANALVTAYAGLNRSAQQLAEAAGQTYKAELAPYKLDVLRDSLKVDAFNTSVKLTSGGKLAATRAFASALSNAGHVASASLSAIYSHGNFVERSFS